jgi:predicted nucleic acid-binding protein
MKPVILDAGPLVASLCPRDEHFAWARQAFTQVAPGSLICEAVIAEACHLVAKERVPRARVIEFAVNGCLRSVSLSSELDVIKKLLERYANVGMDFGDACVVRLAELHPEAAVCTTDSDFLIYRKLGNERIPLIAPFGG